MPYAVYYINPKTLTVNIKSFYNKYETAIRNLRTDAEDHIKMYKQAKNVHKIDKRCELETSADGYYIKDSNKYPNRFTIYEKRTRNVGYIFSHWIYEINKILVFSLIELSEVSEAVKFEISDQNRKVESLGGMELLYLDELKEKIKKIRKIRENKEKKD